MSEITVLLLKMAGALVATALILSLIVLVVFVVPIALLWGVEPFYGILYGAFMLWAIPW